MEPDSIEFQTSNNSSINFGKAIISILLKVNFKKLLNILILDDSYKQSDSNEFMENAITNSDNDDKNTGKDRDLCYLIISPRNFILFYICFKFQTKILLQVNVESVDFSSPVM